MRTAKTLIRLVEYLGLAESSLGAHAIFVGFIRRCSFWAFVWRIYPRIHVRFLTLRLISFWYAWAGEGVRVREEHGGEWTFQSYRHVCLETFEHTREKRYLLICALNADTSQPAYPRSRITLRKHAYSNTLKLLLPKNEIKILIFFIFLLKT